MLKVCICKYIVRREISVVKGKFVLLSQESDGKKNKERKKKRKVKEKKKKKMCVAIRLVVQRIKLRGVWGTLSFLEEIFVYERI